MKSILFSLLTLITVNAFAQTVPTHPTQPNQMMMGEWISEYPIYNQGTQIHTRFYFTPTTLNLTATCVFPYTSLSTSLMTNVQYNQNDLYILENKSSTVNDGYRYCNIAVQRDRWQFYFSGNGKLVIFTPIPYNGRFDLIRPTQPTP
ncbi:MAG: hypothetical protein ACK41T_04800 [Pseudobdellovibrio sp.]